MSALRNIQDTNTEDCRLSIPPYNPGFQFQHQDKPPEYMILDYTVLPVFLESFFGTTKQVAKQKMYKGNK